MDDLELRDTARSGNYTVKRPAMKWQQRQWQQILAIAVMALLFWLPRGLGLDQYATADENAWLTRSANFYRALAQGDWGGTFQRHHPGVTVTWAGTMGFLSTYPTYINDAERDFGWLAEELTPFLREHGHEPSELLAAGRQVVVLLIVFALTVGLIFAWRAWGIWPALAGGLLLAFDPFHIAHSRLMHLDGLLSSFMAPAVIALFVALDQQQDRRWRWGALITSSVATGLACLTRSPGIYLLPFAAFMGLILWLQCAWRRLRTPDDTSTDLRVTTQFLLITLGIWVVLAAATFYLFWPAMWVAPVATLREVFNAANSYAEAGHEDPTFFNGVIYNGDPGLWFYPATLLWRTTPVVWLGLILAIVRLGLDKGRLPLNDQADRQSTFQRTATITNSATAAIWRDRATIPLLVLFVIGFWFLMNLGAKKFDRYLLPVYPILDLLAGVGLVAGSGWLWRRWLPRFAAYGQPTFVAMLILLQIGLTLPHYPYYLTYYNPVMGGGQRAAEVMQIGRGEGADQAARSLNRQATDAGNQSPVAASSFPNGPFSYFFQGRTVPPTFWSMADYAVLYTQDVQRQMPSARQVAWLEEQAPLAEIALEGIPYARIYDLANAPLPPFVTTWAQQEVAQIRLNAYELTAGIVQPGATVQTILYFENLAPIAENLNVLVRLIGADGIEITRAEGWPWGAATAEWTTGAIWPDGHQLTIPPATASGYYRLDVGYYEPTTQEPLHATQASNGKALPELVPLDYIQVGPLSQEPAVALAEPYQVGELATLLGYTTETSTGRQIDIQRVPLLPGEDLHLTLFWQVNQNTATDYTTFVHVVDGNGNMLTQQDAQPVQGLLPTSLWHKGQVIVDTYTLTIPDGAALGEYPLYVGLYDLATATRLPIHQGDEIRGDSIPLTRLVVALSRMDELGDAGGR